MTGLTLVFGGLILVAWVVIAAIAIYAIRHTYRLDEVGKAREEEAPPLPRVSIVVTAKNEERKVEQTLRSLLNLDYSDYEVVFVNDRSDDRTGEIAERMSHEDRRIKVLHVDELPDGWFGKNHAAYRGAEAATGEVLLFTDGDVVFEPEALAYGVRHMIEKKLDHLTATPRMSVSGMMLQAALLAFFLFAIVITRPWKVRDPNSSASAGLGPYNMFRTTSYFAIGGHKRIALRPDEDTRIGQLVKRSGLRTDLVRGEKLINCEWYPSLGKLIRGMEKNLFAGLDYSIPMVMMVSVATIGLLVVPFVLVPVLALGAGLFPILLFGFAACICWGLLIVTACGVRYTWWHGLLCPLGTLVMIYTLWRSMILTISRGVAWGGPPVPWSVLRSNCI